MFDDLAAYFYENVIVGYNKYATERSGPSGRSRHVRAAIDIATTLFHLREHLPAQYAKTRAQVERECPEYRLVADFVNAVKHKTLTKGSPLLSKAEDVSEQLIVTRFEDESGEYSDCRTSVLISCSDGVERDLDEHIYAVTNYWIDEMKKMNITDAPLFKQVPKPGTYFVSRSDAKNADMEMVQGIRFKQVLKLLKYDQAKGCAEPVDLTGSEVQWRMYQPKYDSILKLTSPDGQDSIEIPFELSNEQNIAFHALRTDEERIDFMNSLAAEQRDVIDEKIRDAIAERMKKRSDEDH